MKDIIISAVLWGCAMMAGLAILDLLRGNPINWLIVIMGGLVFFGFKIVNGTAHMRNAKYREQINKNSEDKSE